jgi:hypothetical protein
MLKTLTILLLFSSATSTVRVEVNVTPSVQAPRPSSSGSGALMGLGGAAGVGGGVVLVPSGHSLRACKPNLQPEQSAWKDLLLDANGQLCTVTKVPA